MPKHSIIISSITSPFAMHTLPKLILVLSASTLLTEASYDRRQACAKLCGPRLSTLEPKGGVQGRYGEKIGASIGFAIATKAGFAAEIATNQTEFEEHEEQLFNTDGGWNKTEHRHDWGHETLLSPYGSLSLVVGGSLDINYGGRRRRRRRSALKRRLSRS